MIRQHRSLVLPPVERDEVSRDASAMLKPLPTGAGLERDPGLYLEWKEPILECVERDPKRYGGKAYADQRRTLETVP